MTIDRATAFTCDGVSVRMSARRDNGKVLVEYLQPRTGMPLAQWRECWPHELRAAGIGIEHIKSLAVVLPLARFAHDERPAVDAVRKPATADAAPAAQAPAYWWNEEP
jgi:hypothetical protein